VPSGWRRIDLRLFSVWLTDRQVRLLQVQRTHIELYGRWLEEQGRARSARRVQMVKTMPLWAGRL
jgi:hypothetical protein